MFYHSIPEFVLIKVLVICHFYTRAIPRRRKAWFLIYICWAQYHLQPNTDGQHRAWADLCLLAVICRSHDGLLADEKEEKFVSNDTNFIIIQRCAAALYLSSVFRNLSKNGNWNLRVCDLNWLRPAPTKLLQTNINCEWVMIYPYENAKCTRWFK